MPELPNLAGKILLAHPNLHDPNFRRSIVYLARHDAQTGAFGFIINRPTTQTLEELDFPEIPPFFDQIELYRGGPVSVDSLLFVTLRWDAFLKKMTVEYSNDPREIDSLQTIAVIGYAGWSAGQLEEEILQDAWLIQDLDEIGDQLKGARASTWKILIARIHPHLKLLAEMPDNVSLN